MKKSLVLLTVTLLLSGCQSLIHKTSDAPPMEKGAAIETKAQPEKHTSFQEDTLYSLLVAELAGQRDRFDIALSNYVQQARKTRDPGVSERAFRIAEYLDTSQEALETALLWAKSVPNNLDAQRAAAIQLARSGHYDESMVYMEKVLNGHGDTHFDFLALSAAETNSATRSGLLQSFNRLLKKYPDNSQLLFGKALLLQQDSRPEKALSLLESNAVSRHDIALLLLRSRLLQSMKRSDEALSLLKIGVKEHPDDKRVRLAYARLLIEQNRLEDAKSEFAVLIQQFPDDDDLRFSLALVCLEAQAWDEAKVYLKELIKRDSHVDSAHFNLGRLAEEQKDPERALSEYAQIGPGNNFLPAQLRQTEILLDSKRIDEATQFLAKARGEQPDYAIQLYLVEVEALSNNGLLGRAWQTIQQGLKEYPDDLNLLYTRSMLAEKRNNLAQMEKDLRFVIAREPDNAMALNALGYTLADRTTRYAEARNLIQKAHKLNPDDPAILDSLGWVNYRQGNLTEAEKYLRQALERYPDHEVAAHLGEVLWTQGKQSEARQLWREYLGKQSDSNLLRNTIKRLTGTETP